MPSVGITLRLGSRTLTITENGQTSDYAALVAPPSGHIHLHQFT